MSDEELHDHWVKKYYDRLATDLDRLPKWAKNYHNKYHQTQEDSPPPSESEYDGCVEVSDQENIDEGIDDESDASLEEDIAQI